MRVWLVTALVVALVAAALCGAALLAWPQGGLAASPTGLARLSLPGFAGRVESVHVTDGDGKAVPAVLRHGVLWPQASLAQGERLAVTVRVERPGWIGWLVGRRVTRTLSVATPSARPATRLALAAQRRGRRRALLRPGRARPRRQRPATQAPGAEQRRRARAARRRRDERRHRARRRRAAFLGATRDARPRLVVRARDEADRATRGCAEHRLAAVSRSRADVELLAPGRTGARLEQAAHVAGDGGHWTQVDANTLAFRPGPLGFPLGATIHLRLPRPVLVGGRRSAR